MSSEKPETLVSWHSWRSAPIDSYDSSESLPAATRAPQASLPRWPLARQLKNGAPLSAATVHVAMVPAMAVFFSAVPAPVSACAGAPAARARASVRPAARRERRRAWVFECVRAL
jgi:hypothetical protein